MNRSCFHAAVLSLFSRGGKVLLALVVAAVAFESEAATNDVAASAKPNSKLTAIPENAWQRVAGFAPVPAGILAYSGGVYDSVNHELLIFGGGHADYWGNESLRVFPSDAFLEADV